MKSCPQKLLALILSVLLLSSCGSQPGQRTSTPSAPSNPKVSNTPTNVSIAINTITPLPALPADINATPVPGPTSTPTRAPVADVFPVDNPLSIEYLRQVDYPGSSIIFEQELEPGSNYSRFYVSYRSEGLKIYALMTIPDGEPPDRGWPVIIFNHGYTPPGVYRTTERYIEYMDELAKAGYILFRPDYRGHDRSEGRARGAYGYPDYTIDVLNAVASMMVYTDTDPDRIGMWGHSMGGYLTLRCMVISKDIKIGVIWAGVVAAYPDLVNNWPQYISESPEIANNWRTSLVSIYGTPSQNPAFWDSISANSYLTELSGSIQLHHGTGDVEVPVEFSTSLYQQLQRAGIPVELYTYENDNHNLSNFFNVAMRRTIQTFDIYLK